MADKERITRPSSGSNELGSETSEDRITGGLSAGSDSQLKLTALAGKKHKEGKTQNEKASKESERKK
jgi:hypothetical protein